MTDPLLVASGGREGSERPVPVLPHYHPEAAQQAQHLEPILNDDFHGHKKNKILLPKLRITSLYLQCSID